MEGGKLTQRHQVQPALVGDPLLAVPAQVGIESKAWKRFITCHFQALKPGAFNSVARDKFTE